MACRHYKAQRRAKIDKFPEPFRVVQKNGEGMFTRRFTAAAAPDYQVWGQIYGHRPDDGCGYRGMRWNKRALFLPAVGRLARL